ncbi:transglycosylase domain-containing protein [Anaerosalibacter massiliensis]|uniref:Transglycosylase domain-containing protein n=1 Tax=Anaerosalibacter massiliensis TaxID=1347392 RepID=A0A9X2MI98_9FIRM|nr:biosynthetic peptidoglycan transglycosylase [Anaerosalibacter massiliensis]MCR2043585.1 transglycosylase domain-containing protein [Anaerosalibacter massiliensis]
MKRFKKLVFFLVVLTTFSLIFNILPKIANYFIKFENTNYDLNRDLKGQIKNNIPNYIDYEEIPEDFINTLITVEDKRFFKHIGFDPIAMGRATLVNVKAREYKQGGSTITQQLAKNLFFTNEKSLGRKVKELIVALAIEDNYTKEDILEMYTNVIYYGEGAYGIEAASQKYFNKSARDMNFDEATLLAGSLKAPSIYNPFNTENAQQRHKVVLSIMQNIY